MIKTENLQKTYGIGDGSVSVLKKEDDRKPFSKFHNISSFSVYKGKTMSAMPKNR